MFKNEKIEKPQSNPKPAVYAAMYEGLEKMAQDMGYCLCIHGSMLHDLDLVAFAWRDGCAPADALAGAFWDEITKYTRHTGIDVYGGKFGHVRSHGRISYVIPIGGDGWYIDLHVFPPRVDGNLVKSTDDFYWRSKERPSNNETVMIEARRGVVGLMFADYINGRWYERVNDKCVGDEIPEESIIRWSKIPNRQTF